MLVREYCKDKKAWLKERGKGIGGSDVASIVGQNPYKTNRQLWREKMGIEKPEDIDDKPQVIYGKYAEHHLRELFKLKHVNDYEVIYNSSTELEIIYDTDYPYLRASLDGELIDKNTGEKGIYECKSCWIENSQQLNKWKNQIPDNYYCQTLHYLGILQYDFVVLNAELIFKHDNDIKSEIREYKFYRKDVLGDIEFIRKKTIEFWTNYIEKNVEPPIQILI